MRISAPVDVHSQTSRRCVLFRHCVPCVYHHGCGSSCRHEQFALWYHEVVAIMGHRLRRFGPIQLERCSHIGAAGSSARRITQSRKVAISRMAPSLYGDHHRPRKFSAHVSPRDICDRVFSRGNPHPFTLAFPEGANVLALTVNIVDRSFSFA